MIFITLIILQIFLPKKMKSFYLFIFNRKIFRSIFLIIGFILRTLFNIFYIVIKGLYIILENIKTRLWI